MARYRKKPVVVEAYQMTSAAKDRRHQWPEWLRQAWEKAGDEVGSLSIGAESKEFFINTLEGRQLVSEGDYIIQGVKGEVYPCKPDIFKMTYQEIK